MRSKPREFLPLALGACGVKCQRRAVLTITHALERKIHINLLI